MSHVAPDIAQRIQWLCPGFHGVSQDVLTVEEQAKDGKGRVDFTVPPGSLKLNIHSHSQYRVQWFDEARTADGIFVVFRDGAAHLHIVELKKSVSQNKWEQIKGQFDGTMLNALALQGVLGLAAFASITVYAAYLNDNLSSFLLKLEVGTENVDPDLDWIADEIRLVTGERARLVKIQCADSAEGFVAQYALPAAS